MSAQEDNPPENPEHPEHPESAGIAENLRRLPPLRAVIAAHGLGARRRLGQHFLLDLNLTARIARAANMTGAGTVIEIGPGPGGLTRALLLGGARNLVAIEKDARCLTALEPLTDAAEGRLRVVRADALEVDLARLGPPPRHVVANLPYNIATPLLIRWLRHACAVQSMTLMFQREVAMRIVAGTGDKSYSRLSVIANWRCRTEWLFGLPGRAFTPVPKVDSAVVGLHPRPDADCAEAMEDMEAVSAAAFGQRRKMLRQSLRSLRGLRPELDLPTLFAQCNIAPTARAEELGIADFACLARAVRALPPPPSS